MRALTILVALSLACGPDPPSSGTEGATTVDTGTTEAADGTSSTGATGTTGTTGTADTTGPTGDVTGAATTSGGDGLSEHAPCPNGDECGFNQLCVQTEGASICGPECYEYGPGPAPGRCPPSPVQLQSICPWDNEVPGVCLIMCEDMSDCPDPGMVCVACPEPFLGACNGLWGFNGTGPNICAWPER